MSSPPDAAGGSGLATAPPVPTGPWPANVGVGAATGVGSMPGLDPADTQARLFDALPALPHLVELPGRGPGADMIGRSAALLTDLAVDLQPAGWRFVARGGRDYARARDFLARDLDALAELASTWTGPLKLQAAGPWTLAATIELTRGNKALQDPSAVQDIAGSLADGLAAHVRAVATLAPAATLLVQLDEPALPAVAGGRIPSASGFSRLRVPEPAELQAVLETVLGSVPFPGVHCCDHAVPVELLRAAGAGWISLDATLLTTADDEVLGTALEAGTGLVLGVEGGDEGPAVALGRRLGLPAAQWRPATVLSPRCGLAGAAPGGAWRTLKATVDAAARFAEQVEDLR